MLACIDRNTMVGLPRDPTQYLERGKVSGELGHVRPQQRQIPAHNGLAARRKELREWDVP